MSLDTVYVLLCSQSNEDCFVQQKYSISMNQLLVLSWEDIDVSIYSRLATILWSILETLIRRILRQTESSVSLVVPSTSVDTCFYLSTVLS